MNEIRKNIQVYLTFISFLNSLTMIICSINTLFFLLFKHGYKSVIISEQRKHRGCTRKHSILMCLHISLLEQKYHELKSKCNFYFLKR